MTFNNSLTFFNVFKLPYYFLLELLCIFKNPFINSVNSAGQESHIHFIGEVTDV